MGGLTDKGFDYNGAWGGPSMQMGGSMPGAVGFTYARTINPAPSKGKYAKKTMASAQNGMEMKFYQEGLDWTPKNISMNGKKMKKAQIGVRQRAASENTKVKAPRTDMLTMDEANQMDEANRFWEIMSKQATIGSPSIVPGMSRDQVIDKNLEYARRTGKKVDPNTGKVSPALSPSAAKKLGRLEESIINTAGYALDKMDVATKMVQSAYKPGYTLEDALNRKDSGAGFLEDVFTDPTNLASFGLKGLGKGLLKTLLSKGVLTKGALSKGLLSSAVLPFYKSAEANPIKVSDLADQLNKTREIVSSKDARNAFRRTADYITRSNRLADLDPEYLRAIHDENLPLEAVDQLARTITSIDPEQTMLDANQVKYLGNISNLTTTLNSIDRGAVPFKDRGEFIVKNARNVSPRDLLPLIYNEHGLSAAGRDELKEVLEKLYESYGGVPVANPMGRATAMSDLFSLSDAATPNSTVSYDVSEGLEKLAKIANEARPIVTIDDPFLHQSKPLYNTREAIHFLVRGMNKFKTIPSAEEIKRGMIETGRKANDTIKDIFSDPANKGQVYTGAHSLSTDSYPLTLSQFSKNRNILEFSPVHIGHGPNNVYFGDNEMGGIARFAHTRPDFLRSEKINSQTMGLTNTRNAVSTAYGVPRYFEDLEKQSVQAALMNHHINAFNKLIGTNLPSAYTSYGGGGIRRPMIAATIKKNGGPVKDNMGYWNPENWGKPVEIDSNDITMQGVYEPLLGISDTGDVQMMYPGEDYTFDGDTVTEYPIKKNSNKAQKGLKVIPRSTGDISSYAPKINVKKEMSAAVSDEQKRDFLRSQQTKKAIERQGEIRSAKDQSTGSKIWEVLTNPVEYLGYKVRGQRVPEHFSKGETKSTALNTAVNMLNPFEMVDSGIDFVSDIGDIGENIAKGNFRDAGMGTIPAIAHALGAFPMVIGASATADVLKPVVKSAKKAFKATSDLPMSKRVVNAINTGALKAKIEGDVMGHTYFNMTPEAVQKAMSDEIANLPKNALSYDNSMSINSAPLYWNQAARMKNQGFTVVRPGVDQPLNFFGNQGRRVGEALPSDVKALYPDIVQEHANRVAFLRSIGDEAGANAVEKKGIIPNLLTTLQSDAIHGDPIKKQYYNQFLQNYKSTLDRSVEAVNRATGLNFPSSTLEGYSYKMPTIVAVKGNPLGRIPKSVSKELSKSKTFNSIVGPSSAINQEADVAKRKKFNKGGWLSKYE